jgi:hypothetical protein
MTAPRNAGVSVFARATILVVLASGCNQLLGIEERSALAPDAAGSDGSSKEAAAGADSGGRDGSAITDGSAELEAPGTDVPISDPCLAIHVDPQTLAPVAGNGPALWSVASWALYLVPSSDVQAALFSVWAPLHVYDPAYGVFKSATPHLPPYDHELAAGLEQAGFTNTGCVNRASLTQNSDLILSLVMVPTADAPAGNSFDGQPGAPALPGAFALQGSLYANGSLLTSDLLQSFPTPSALHPGTSGMGSTHLVANFDLMSFTLPAVKNVPGNYGFVLSISNSSSPSQPPATQQSVQFTVE